jgi:antitoxin component YwqK of YwqJK toxin-antitoxin module
MVQFKFIYIIFTCLLLSCSKSQVVLTDEDLQNDIVYKKNSLIPFDGTIVLENKNNKLVSQKQSILGGKLNGESVIFFSNGKAKIKGHYKDGLFEGLWEKWYSNGNREYLVNYSNGLMSGECTSWYENGKLNEKGYYSDNIKVGKWIKYNNDGLLIEESKH